MSESAGVGVKLYWRPGCPYCTALRARLRRLGVSTIEINIWDDPAGAAVVQQVAGGNETVPTVVIGDTALVNPTGRAVLAAARRWAPDSVNPERARPRPNLAAMAAAAWSVVKSRSSRPK